MGNKAVSRNWTKEECDYLIDKWGTSSLGTISKNLGRTEIAILNKVQRMGAGSFLESGEYITWNQLLIALGTDSGSYKNTSWISNRKFPVKYKKVKNNSFKVVCLDDWWKWAEKNRDLLDFSKFQENSLGKEPEWAKEKRRRDIDHNRRYTKEPWTRIEDEKLKKYLKDFKYSYAELTKMLRRTSGAIQRRILDLNLKERPVKVDNHIKWTETEFLTLWNMIDDGYSYELIAEKIGKSSKAIRGRVYSYYATENLDKVREKRKKVS
jgi:hypothetical protein